MRNSHTSLFGEQSKDFYRRKNVFSSYKQIIKCTHKQYAECQIAVCFYLNCETELHQQEQLGHFGAMWKVICSQRSPCCRLLISSFRVRAKIHWASPNWWFSILSILSVLLHLMISLASVLMILFKAIGTDTSIHFGFCGGFNFNYSLLWIQMYEATNYSRLL